MSATRVIKVRAVLATHSSNRIGDDVRRQKECRLHIVWGLPFADPSHPAARIAAV